MAEKKSDWVDAVVKLTRLTQRGELEWSMVGPFEPMYPATSAEEEASVYVTIRAGRFIRLIGRTFRRPMRSREETEPGGFVDTFFELALVDEDGRTLWRFPNVQGLGELYAAVQYQTAGVGDLLDELLATVLLRDDLETFSGWQEYIDGVLRREVDPTDSSRHCLMKCQQGDPSGGFKLLQEPTNRGFSFRGRLLSLSSRSGGEGNRLSVTNEDFDGYGFVIYQNRKTLALERRRKGRATALSAAVEANVPTDEWYGFRLDVSESTVSVSLSDDSGAIIAELAIEDSEQTGFDRVVVHGGYDYYIGDLLVVSLS